MYKLDKVKDALNVGKSQLISSKTLFEAEQYRDSITMSYYAMYSSALALLLKKDISPLINLIFMKLFI